MTRNPLRSKKEQKKTSKNKRKPKQGKKPRMKTLTSQKKTTRCFQQRQDLLRQTLETKDLFLKGSECAKNEKKSQFFEVVKMNKRTSKENAVDFPLGQGGSG